MICPQCQAENQADSRFCHKCATPLLIDKEHPLDQTLTLEFSPAGLPRGTLFAGRYEIIEELGRGGMGRVYKVFDQKIGEVIALKVIHPEISLNEKAVDRFRNELRFARKIGHRHVCRMFDLGETDHTFYITMEYVDGENLKSFIRRSVQLAPRKAISLGKQVSEGLSEAHRLGIIHRDLKPQNIMIDREGNARIMDFGIARFTEAEGLTGSGVMIGTPEYMSPEQAETLEVDKRADIYALGVILYEMVTGRVPFAGETPLAALLKHKQDRPVSPQETNPLVSEDLTRIILKCLSKDKTARYQSAEELLEDLTAAEGTLPQAEKTTAARPRGGARHRAKPWLWVGAGLAVVVALVLAWRQFSLKEPARHVEGETGRASRVYVGRPPQPPEVEPRVEKAPGQKTEGTGGILSLLSPEVLRKLGPKEIQGLLDFEKQMANIKGAIPPGTALDEIWTSVYQKVHESKRLREEGRIEEAQKSGKEGQDEMQRLLTTVAQRDKALEAKGLMTRTKMRVQTVPGSAENVLFRVAARREQDAQSAFDKNDFSGSRTLCSVLTEVFKLSGQCADTASCLKGLAARVGTMRSAAENPASGKSDPWLKEKAGDFERMARLALSRNDPEGAAEQYIQAAFLYQKMIDQGS